VVLGTESAAEVWCESVTDSQLLVSFHGDRLATWTAAVEWAGRFCPAVVRICEPCQIPKNSAEHR